MAHLFTPYSHTQTTSVHITRPVCEGDNLWRGNDTTRGLSPARVPNWDEDDTEWEHD